MEKLSKLFASIVLVVLLVLCFTSLGTSAELRKVVFGYSTVGAMAAGAWMAKEIGAYEKYGIDAELIYISSGPTVVQALLGGDVTGGIAATNAVVAAVLRGAPLVSVVSTANRPYHRLFVQPDRVERLKSVPHFRRIRSPVPLLRACGWIPASSRKCYSNLRIWGFSIPWT